MARERSGMDFTRLTRRSGRSLCRWRRRLSGQFARRCYMALPGHGLQDPCAPSGGNCLCPLPRKFPHRGRSTCETWLRLRRHRGNTSHMVPYVVGRRFSYLQRSPGNRWDDVRGLLIADERWGVLEFANDPRLQSREYVEGPCGNYHPPVRLDWKEGSLKGVRELQPGAHAQFGGGHCLPPLACLRFRCLLCVGPTWTRRGMRRGTPELRGHGAAHIMGSALARFSRVPHTLTIAVSAIAMGPTYPG